MLEIVKDYYGRQLSGSADLKTTTCCSRAMRRSRLVAGLLLVGLVMILLRS